jgi:hypothetical protein
MDMSAAASAQYHRGVELKLPPFARQKLIETTSLGACTQVTFVAIPMLPK